jgi:hypothetical protein
MGRKLLALYFGLTMFNNFAFQFLPGATLGDCFGIVGAVYYGFELMQKRRFIIRFSLVGTSIFFAALAMTVHAFWISVLYPSLNADGAGLIRSLVIAKIFVLSVCCCLYEENVATRQDCEWIIRQVLTFSLIGIACYFVQAGMLLAGRVPYGTFLDAGYIGFPTFGSVSIERGHFGKFMTPLFPLFLIMFLRERKRLAFFSFLLVTLFNFSASSLSFLGFYVTASALQFRKNLFRPRSAFLSFLVLGVLFVFASLSWTLWIGLAQKIGDQVGGEGGGRGISLLITYLEKYPMGLSYGGSSLRTPAGLPEMNGGLGPFIAQESLLAFPLIGAFLCLVYSSLRACRRIPDLCLSSALKTGILIMPFIFLSDSLWFVPTIWLPMLLARQLGRTATVRVTEAPLTRGTNLRQFEPSSNGKLVAAEPT